MNPNKFGVLVLFTLCVIVQSQNLPVRTTTLEELMGLAEIFRKHYLCGNNKRYFWLL